LGAIIQNFKSVSTRNINQARDAHGTKIWQRNYWEHIVRDNVDLDRVRKYIIDNPANWDSDDENPNCSRKQ
jgi:putative transposase